MEDLKIEKTSKTPEVTIDCSNGRIGIIGICIPENSKDFFEPIIKKIDCIDHSKSQIIFDIYLEYFNTGSSIGLLNLFLKVAKLKGAVMPGKVIWKVDEDDEDILESGEILEEISKLDFEFVEIPER